MRKILIIFVMLTALYSCKKSSDATITPDTPVVVAPTTASLLLGQWTYLKDSTTTYTNGVPTVQQTTYTNASMSFNSNGAGIDMSTAFFYNLADKKLTLNYPAYQVTTGGVTSTIPEQTYTATITVISATKLTLYYNYTAKDSNGFTTGYTTYSILSK